MATEKKTIDIQAFEAWSYQFEDMLSRQDWDGVTQSVEQYSASDDFNSHLGANIIEAIAPYSELLDLAEQIARKSIAENTIENLSRLNPAMATEHKQDMDFGWLYSLLAWILWKRECHKESQTTIEHAISYRSKSHIQPEDHLRLGIISYYNGKKEQGWKHVATGLLMDSQIEHRDPDYLQSLQYMVEDRFAPPDGFLTFLFDFRTQHAESVSHFSFRTIGGHQIKISELEGKTIFLNFFNPGCSSCCREIAHLGALYRTYFSRPDTAFLFVLNPPKLQEEGFDLLKKNGIEEPTLVIVQTGSAYDLISAEPTTWIIDKKGKRVRQYVGYENGDDLIYQRELAALNKENTKIHCI